MPADVPPTRPSRRPGALAARLAMGTTFTTIGALHFVAPASFEAIVPDALPAKRLLVYGTGVLETAGGIQLLRRPSRRLGLALVVLLLAIFPANVNQAFSDIAIDGLPKPPRWLLFARLPVQALMIWAVLVATRPTEEA